MKGLQEDADPMPGLTLGRFWQVIRSILVHRDFNRCTEQKNRSLPHLFVFWGFILLLFVTFFAILSTIFFEYPLGILNPIKIAGNLGAFLLLTGSSLMILHRLRKKNGLESRYGDWFFLVSFWLLTLSGMLVEGARFHEWSFAYHLYFVHLILVWIIILYLPYTKFAHFFYRTTALVFLKQKGL
jgi:quinone-modifying oxidoreductase subunit QmoC